MTQVITAGYPPCSLGRRLPRLGFLVLLFLTLPGIAQAQFTYVTNNGAITIAAYTGDGGKVTIPSTVNGLAVTAIGDSAFAEKVSLTDLTIPESVISIGPTAFAGCSSLTNVMLPTSVTSIDWGAFASCSSLRSVAIPNSVTNLGWGAFYSCTGLTSVTIATGITSIERNVFDGCRGLTNVTIPDSVTHIAEYAFVNCSSLSDVTLGSGITVIGEAAFLSCYSLASIAIPSNVVSIEAGAFSFCGLTSITISTGVANIGVGAFSDCHNLTRVAIGNSVTNLGNWAFTACSSLTSIALPDSIIRIGDAAFADCPSLDGVVFHGDAPILSGSNVFQFNSQLTVYYLPGTSGWDATFGGRPTALWSLPYPLITAQPIGAAIDRGTTISFAVTAIGRSVLSYQWKHRGVNLSDGDNISGANTASLTINSARLSNGGDYAVMVSDSAGSVISQPAQLSVFCVSTNEAEAFVIRTNEAESFVIRSFTGGTNGSFRLVWDSCCCNLYEVQTSEKELTATNWVARALMISDETATVWSDSNAPAINQRFYRVRRYSPAGDEDADGLSNVLEFNRGTDLHNPDSDGDQMTDGWEAQYGLNPLDPNDRYLDLDDDRYSNFQEYRARTRPNAASSRPADVLQGLAAWWKLDQDIGTNVFDSSLNGHDGYVLGSNPGGAWTAGYLSNALTLGGPANNWVQVPYRPSLTPNQELTLTGWVKPLGQGVLIGNWDSGQVSGNYRLQFAPDEVELRFSPAGDGLHSTLRFNPNWSTSDWHHLTVRYGNGTNLTVLVDGEERASQTVAGPFVPVPNPILIGFPGLTDASSVDDVRLYHRALNTTEIAALSRGNGLPVSMIVGQTATLRAFAASDGDPCQWSMPSGQGFFINTGNLTTEFRPSWSGTATVQVVYGSSGLVHTNLSITTVTFPSLSPIAEWNEPNAQAMNNCYNFATDIRTDTRAQPGGPPYYNRYTCELQTSAAISDGLQAGVDLGDLCHTSGLPGGHIVALLIWPDVDFHYLRLEANGMWSSKAGNLPATTLDNSGQPIVDPLTANFAPYQFCQFFWVGPDVNILHYPQ